MNNAGWSRVRLIFVRGPGLAGRPKCLLQFYDTREIGVVFRGAFEEPAESGARAASDEGAGEC